MSFNYGAPKTDFNLPNYFEELEVNRRISARNLRAIKRLSRWTVHNRRIWTALAKKFKGVQVLISSVPSSDPRPSWQRRLLLGGKAGELDMWGLSSNRSSLVRIGSCKDDSLCDLHFFGNNKNLRNDGGIGHMHHIDLGFYD